MKKVELEAQIKSLKHSVGWYYGAYYRLKESEALAQERIESLEEEIEAYERDFEERELKRSREQQKALRQRKARQAELLKQQLKVQQSQMGAPPTIDEDDSLEGRLERCQQTNANLRIKIAKLESEIKALKS